MMIVGAASAAADGLPHKLAFRLIFPLREFILLPNLFYDGCDE
jgi:hypothetical protein